METTGQAASTFRMCSRTLPSYPASVPVQERDTFWRWQKDETNCDLMIASQTTILNSLLHAAGGNPNLVDAVDMEHIKDLCSKMRKILLANVLKNVTLHDPVCGEAQEERPLMKEWLKLLRDETTPWPVGCAKPVNLQDYRRLGSLLNMEYLGAPDQRTEGEAIVDKTLQEKLFFRRCLGMTKEKRWMQRIYTCICSSKDNHRHTPSSEVLFAKA